MSGWATRILGPVRPGFRVLTRPGPPPPWDDAIPRIEGIPLLRLRGSPAEQGRTHGLRLAPQIHHLRTHYLGVFLGTGAARRRVERLVAGMETHLLEEEREEMRGLAGALDGLGEEEALLANVFLDAHKVAFCSVVLARDARTGRPLFGRNLDFPSLGVAHRMGLVFVHEPRDGRRYATVGWPGLLGALSGMNEDGLALAVNLVYGEHDVEAGVPLTLALRRVLAESRRLAEAEVMLRGIRFASSNNVTVCDAEGNAAVYEIGPGTFTRRRVDGESGCATNHFASCRRWPRLSPISLSSHLRYRVLRGTRRDLARRGSLREVVRALGRVGIPGATIQSMVFLPGEARMRVSMGRTPATRGRFVLLDRRTLWGG